MPPSGGFFISRYNPQIALVIKLQDWVVDKKRARLNCINHLLSQVPYGEVEHPPVELPARVYNPDYYRAPISEALFVPSIY